MDVRPELHNIIDQIVDCKDPGGLLKLREQLRLLLEYHASTVDLGFSAIDRAGGSSMLALPAIHPSGGFGVDHRSNR